MAELHVQPKKNNWLPWLLLGLGVIALIYFLARGCNHKADTTPVTDTIPTTSTTTTTTTTQTTADTNWSRVDFNAPPARYEEIRNSNIDVRGNNDYSIYGVGEDVLFDKGSASLRPDAEQNLQQVATSIQKRHSSGAVRIYGFTDATGNAGANRALSERRAEAVRDWLTSKGNISGERLSLHPQGESGAVASNATESGRQQNRRVMIVARGR